MAEALKNLGQVSPAAKTITPLYTVPGAASAVVSSIVICNTGNVSATFNISHAISGAADTIAQYLYDAVQLDPSETFIAVLGMTLAATDVVRCAASVPGVAFNLYGSELT